MQIRYLSFTLFCALFLLWHSLSAQDGTAFEVSLIPSTDDNFALVDEIVKEPFVLEKLSIQTDVALSIHEIKSLTGLKEGQLTTAQDLKKACWFLKRKNKFDSITFSPTHGKAGVLLNLMLTARWTFAKMQFKGSFTGKEKLEPHYMLVAGEEFTLDKHQHSVDKIVRQLHADGYFTGTVKDFIAYDKSTKTVTVTLHTDKTERFLTGAIACDIVAHKAITSAEIDSVRSKIVSKITGHLKGQYFNKAAIHNQIEVIRRYLASKGFFSPDIQVRQEIDTESKQVNLFFSVKLCQKKRFVFFGNHFFSTDALLNEMMMIGGSTLLIPPSLLAEDIKQLYKKKGFLNIEVEWKEEPDHFFFLIKEGLQMRVTHVEIDGESTVATSSAISTLFKEFCAQRYYDADKLTQALDQLAFVYRQEGFWDFMVLKKNFEALSNGSDHKLVIAVSPGAQRKLRAVTIENNPELENAEIFNRFKNLPKAIPFNLYWIQEQRQWLSHYFRTKGFLYSKISPELVCEVAGIKLIWHIDTAPGQICFGKTVVEGAGTLAPKLLRELPYKEGDLFDKEKIAQAVMRLKSLGIFESVSLAPYDLGTMSPAKTMVLKYVEDYPYEVRARFGFQQVSKNLTRHGGTTYKAGGSFLWKNPLGQGDYARLDADITRYTRHASGQYELPWLWNQPVRGIFKGYSTVIEQPIVVGCPERLYKVSQDGFLSNLRRAFNYGQADFTLGVEWMKISGLSHELARKIDYEPKLVDKREPYIVIEPALILDFLDNQLNPTCGSYTFASAKGMVAIHIEKGSFLKLLLEQSFFWPLRKWAIGGLRFRFGHIMNEKFSTIIPTERFYLGGSNSLRGYEPDMAPPLNSFIGIKNERFWVPIGGKSMININTEVRFPVYQQLSGVIFSDMGALADDKQFHWVGATGFGIRYDTPISPLRFDIGWKWRKRRDDDRRYAWFLTLGHAF